jgi:class 3 adenylate cyclase/tetratricopeptide (TPR) repeat protein
MTFVDQVKTATGSVRQIRKFWTDRAEWEAELAVDFKNQSLSANGPGFQMAASVYTKLTKAATRFGENLLALEIAVEGRRTLLGPFDELYPEITSRELQALDYQRAIALSRLGSIGEAQRVLRTLLQCQPNNPDALSALGRTYKDLGLAALDPVQRSEMWEKSRRFYLQAFAITGDYYPAINACTVALWLRDYKEAWDLARRVGQICAPIIEKSPDDYWALATRAEADLVLSSEVGAITDQALNHYRQAAESMTRQRSWGDLSSMRKQAKLICEFESWDFGILEGFLRVPDVIIFSGHMLDRSNRAKPRFPAALLPQITAEIEKRLAQCNATIGISSAACGSDLLFVQAMLARGAEIHVVLPWRKEEFIRTSVAVVHDPIWAERFTRALNEATSLTFLSQQSAPSGSLGYVYCNDCMNGMAIYRAETLGSQVVPMAVWDGKRGDGLGGTSSFVSFWRSRERDVEIIQLPSLEEPQPNAPQLDDYAFLFDELKVSQGQQAVKTLLFADVVGYSKISEEQIEYFAPEFLGMISRLISEPPRPVLTNTWGDAIYLVFDDPIDAGTVALRLLKSLNDVAWRRHLTAPLDLRIGLHTGPVILCVDPVIRQISFTGSHVSHAARIEPMVREGEVWATEAFVSYATIANNDRRKRGEEPSEFGFDYLGQVDFAKGYGRYPLFRLSSAVTNAL